MHCNGKCQAMKKIREEERKEQQNNERGSEYKVQQVLSSKSFFYPVIIPVRSSVKIMAHNNFDIPEGPYSAIFHPPQA